MGRVAMVGGRTGDGGEGEGQGTGRMGRGLCKDTAMMLSTWR